MKTNIKRCPLNFMELLSELRLLKPPLWTQRAAALSQTKSPEDPTVHQQQTQSQRPDGSHVERSADEGTDVSL